MKYSLVAQILKNPPAMCETRIPTLGQEDPLEKGMATHSSILAWRIPWTEEPGGLQSMGLPRVRHDWATSPHEQPRSLGQTLLQSKVCITTLIGPPDPWFCICRFNQLETTLIPWYIFIEKYLDLSGTMPFKPVLFKCQLYCHFILLKGSRMN